MSLIGLPWKVKFLKLKIFLKKKEKEKKKTSILSLTRKCFDDF
jgi:hypothetical protein